MRNPAGDPVYRSGRWFNSAADWFAWVNDGKPEDWPPQDGGLPQPSR